MAARIFPALLKQRSLWAFVTWTLLKVRAGHGPVADPKIDGPNPIGARFQLC